MREKLVDKKIFMEEKESARMARAQKNPSGEGRGGDMIYLASAGAFVVGAIGGILLTRWSFRKGLQKTLAEHRLNKAQSLSRQREKPFRNSRGDLVGPLILDIPRYDGYSEIIYNGQKIPTENAPEPAILEIHGGYTVLKMAYD